jgi:hypothetical protein
MFDDTASLFYQGAVAAYDRYVAVRDKPRAGCSLLLSAAIDVCSALYHYREHLPPHLARSRSHVVRECSEYRLIADVTNAVKHKVLTRSTSEGAPLVTSAEDVTELLIITQFRDDRGEYSDAQLRVVAQCSDGSTKELDGAIIKVLNYWGELLDSAGIVGYYCRCPAELPGSRFIPRVGVRSVDHEAVQGLRFALRVQLQAFDAELGRSIPIDLTGADIRFEIYKPAYTFELTAKCPTTGKVLTCTLQLSDEESWIFHRIRDDAEREAFLSKVSKERRTEILDKLRASFENEASSALDARATS